MNHSWWKLLSFFVLAAVAAGCDSCQQTTAPPAPTAEKPAAIAPGAGAKPTMAPAAMMPTSRELPTIGEGTVPTPPHAAAPMQQQPEAGAAAEGEGDTENEADCSVIADAEPDFGPPPLTVHFTVDYECTEGSGTISWDFGDGASPSNETNPTHTYQTAGDYVAIAKVTTSDGASTTDEVDIEVEHDEGDGGADMDGD